MIWRLLFVLLATFNHHFIVCHGAHEGASFGKNILSVTSNTSVLVDFERSHNDPLQYASRVSSLKVMWDVEPGVGALQALSTVDSTENNEVQIIQIHASDVNEVQIVKTRSEEILEVQRISTSASSGQMLGGVFSLVLDTTSQGGSVEASGDIRFDAGGTGGRDTLMAALEAMQNIGSGGIEDISVGSPDAEDGRVWEVTFAAHMADLPPLQLGSSNLTGLGNNVQLETVTNGNLLSNSFLVVFDGARTGELSHSSSAADMKGALEELESVTTVDVVRTGPDVQGGYEWTITFTSDDNRGDLPLMTTVSSLGGVNSVAEVLPLQNGNVIGGQFSLNYTSPSGDSSVTDMLAFDATAADVATALMGLGSISPASVDVHRTGPDLEGGYTWRVSFRGLSGDLSMLLVDTSELTGVEVTASVSELQKGVVQEVQTISTSNPGGSVSASSLFKLMFNDEVTGPIALNPDGGACAPSVREVQVITVVTKDATGNGGDFSVDPILTFQLTLGGETTGDLYAYPQAGSCDSTGASIEEQLELFAALGDVTVSSSSPSDQNECTWTVQFDTNSGNLEQLSVSSAAAGTGAVVVVGDDEVGVTTSVDGTVDAVKYELERLPGVGVVSVVSSADDAVGQAGCTWSVTFETAVGDLPQLQVAIGSEGTYTSFAASVSDAGSGDVIGVCGGDASGCVDGTGEKLGGMVALEYGEERSGYFPHDASAEVVARALLSLPSLQLHTVSVAREGPDENNGYTWVVSFPSYMGDVAELKLDVQALTGSRPSTHSQLLVIGQSPPFNAGNPELNLPLGSAMVSDLSDLSVAVTGLHEGTTYFFRAFTVSDEGVSTLITPMPVPAVPALQSSSAPGVSVSALDGSSLLVSLEAPVSSGGAPVENYRVEWGTAPLKDEVQEIELSVSVVSEVQTVSTSAGDVDEVQVVHARLRDSFDGTDVSEVQHVECDATGGYFTISFRGETTGRIAWDEADPAAIKLHLEQLSLVRGVSVAFYGGASRACTPYDGNGGYGFAVTFLDIVGMAGDMPLMETHVNDLEGARRADVSEATQGSAGLGGVFRLTFKGSTTQDIPVSADENTMLAALTALDTIPAGGVGVQRVDLSNGEVMWRLTFTAPELGGDVVSMVCHSYDDLLTGQDAAINIYTDGLESELELRGEAPSVRGNQLGGSFTLSLLGHETAPIEFNAADTTVQAKLESLPNVGGVEVVRSGPSSEMGFVWTITFTSTPGAFPAGAWNVPDLVADASGLTGSGAGTEVEEVTAGSDSLNGWFQLEFTGNGDVLRTSDLPYDASSAEVKAALEALDNIGRVSVERTASDTGFRWLVSFDECRNAASSPVPVCSIGNMEELVPVSEALTGGATVSLTTTEIIEGQGPGSCPHLVSGVCQGTVSDVTGGGPFLFQIGDLELGVPYFVRAYAYTAVSYGKRGSAPDAVAPSHTQPGAPPAPTLIASTATSITVGWEPPTKNGGSAVIGYELWMDDWAGGDPWLAFDGTGQPGVVEYTATAGVKQGQQVRFQVRALSYCHPAETAQLCYGELSEAAAFVARAPRAPLAVATPTRGSLTREGGISGDDAHVTVNWAPPVDNGGSSVTSYHLYMAEGASELFEEVVLSAPLQYSHAVAGLQKGAVYRFYVTATNVVGSGDKSPVLAVLAAGVPGRDTDLVPTYSSVQPAIVDVLPSEISLSWVPPIDTGGSPISGFKVYMYEDVAFNSVTDPYPVKQEVQRIVTSVAPTTSEKQTVTILGATGGSFRLNVLGMTSQIIPLTSASQSAIQTALQSIVTVTATRPVVSGAKVSFTLEFTGVEGGVEEVVVDTSGLTTSGGGVITTSAVRTVVGTAPLGGDFTVAFRGAVTPHLAHDISADALQEALENLHTVGVVSVVKEDIEEDLTTGKACAWTVQFETEMGALEALQVTAGRLTGGGGSASIFVERQPGTTAQLVYDGQSAPGVYHTTVGSLTAGTPYAFKVVPVNAVGSGISSVATTTVTPRAGASAAQTTASGDALATAFAGVVFEEQRVVAVDAEGRFTLRYVEGGVSAAIDVSVVGGKFLSATQLEEVLSAQAVGAGDVHVTLESGSVDGKTEYVWTVTFLDQTGDVSELVVESSGLTSGMVSCGEFVKGRVNQFKIEPKKASGGVVNDETAVAGFGQDLFFTELWEADDSTTLHDGSHGWISDGGVATYEPVLFEIQTVTIPSGSTGLFKLKMDMTSGGDAERLLGEAHTTGDALSLTAAGLAPGVSAEEVKSALELLPNVRAVDVSYTEFDAGGGIYSITFTEDLGDVPLLQYVAGVPSLNLAPTIEEVQRGVTEVQTVTVMGGSEFVREIQTITTEVSSGSASGTFELSLDGMDAVTEPLNFDCSELEMADALESLPGVGATEVSRSDELSAGSGTYEWTVQFLEYTGDVPNVVAVSSVDGADAAVGVVEVVKGVSPLSGTFVIGFGGAFTADLAFDTSAATLKSEVETLPSVGEVNVVRSGFSTGFTWTVSFTQLLGDIPLLVALPHRMEVQTVSSSGGDPRVLGGTFKLSLGGATTAALRFNATSEEVEAGLEPLVSSIGAVDVSRETLGNNAFEWRVTFWSTEGNIPTLIPDDSLLDGTDAALTSLVTIAGSTSSLVGSDLSVAVAEAEAGRPFYTGSYVAAATGNVALAVRQVSGGGLSALYYDNKWFANSPSVRVDPEISFDWDDQLITEHARESVSIRWFGKLMPDTTEVYTFYLFADDGARLWLDHVLRVDCWESCRQERRVEVALRAGHLHDIKLEYKNELGGGSIRLQWSSVSMDRQTISRNHLFHVDHVSGSPFAVTVLPGAADYPYTTAYGEGLKGGIAGEVSTFSVQAKDGEGNLKLTQVEDGADSLTVVIVGPTGAVVEVTDVSLQGDGLYRVTYMPTSSGEHSVSVRMGGTHIYCGLGEADRCSPFALAVAPGAVSVRSEAQGLTPPTPDGMVNAVAGTVSMFMIQAKDSEGNNRLGEDDVFNVMAVLSSDSDVTLDFSVQPRGEGLYEVTYTAQQAGLYTLGVSVGDELINHCLSPGSRIQDRRYSGWAPYVSPAGCTREATQLVVAHGALHAASSTATDDEDSGLSHAVVGVASHFVVSARDAFGNQRAHVDDVPDAFLVEYEGAADGYRVVTSSATQRLASDNSLVEGYFKLWFAGAETHALPHNVSAAGLQAALGLAHDGDAHQAVVTRGTDEKGNYYWDVTFTSHLSEWSADPLRVVKVEGWEETAETLSVRQHAVGVGGDYPVEATLWRKGVYKISVTSEGEHIFGSPFPLFVEPGPVYAESSLAFGTGLEGGVAGEEFFFTVQAKDERQVEQQVISTAASVVESVAEVQRVTVGPIGADTFSLNFRSALTATADIGAGTSFTSIASELSGLFTVGGATVAVTHINSVDNDGAVTSGMAFDVTFVGIPGPLPLLESSHAVVKVERITVGVAAFRSEVQTLRCEATSGSFDISFGGSDAITIDATETVTNFGEVLEAGIPGLSSISVSTEGGQVSVCAAGAEKLYITFLANRGDLEALVVDPTSLGDGGTVDIENGSGGGVDGLYPLWGTFTLAFGGEVTDRITFDASALEVKSKLEALVGIGEVSVEQERVGYDTAAMDSTRGLWSVWTVSFDGSLAPLNLGDLPLLEPNTSGLLHSPSGQREPTVHVIETRAGSSGNAREDDADLDALSFGLVPSAGGPSVGMKHTLYITCRAESGSFSLQYGDQSINVPHSRLLKGLERELELLPGIMDLNGNGISVIASDGRQTTVCAADPSRVLIQFNNNRPDSLQPMVVTATSDESVVVEVGEDTRGVSSVEYAGGGSYTVTYTPTVTGHYSSWVKLHGRAIGSDLSSGVRVSSAQASAPHSVLTSSLVTSHGVEEGVRIDGFDRFSNQVDGLARAEAQFLITLDRDGDVWQEQGMGIQLNDGVPSVVSEVKLSADGSYRATFTSMMAGEHTLSVLLRAPDGSLAHVQNSPRSVYVYPGAVSANVSEASGDCLVEGTALEPCEFLVVSKDDTGNFCYNSGGEQWEAQLIGVGGWAGEGRVNDVFTGTPAAVSATVLPLDWSYLGTVKATHGSAFISTESNLEPFLSRGDTIIVGQERFIVHESALPFDAGSVPLSSPYRGETAFDLPAFRGGAGTGSYAIEYNAEAKGTYRLDVQLPRVDEVQAVSTYAESALGGSFALLLTRPNDFNEVVTSKTEPIGFSASASELKEALEALDNVPADSIIVQLDDCIEPSDGCTWVVTFSGLGSVDLLVADTELLAGNSGGVAVAEVETGKPPRLLSGTSFTVAVAPGPADATISTAHGAGVREGTAGEESVFWVVVKDSAGNNREDWQPRELLQVLAFRAHASADDSDSVVVAGVEYTADGFYRCTYTPTQSGLYTVAVTMSTRAEVQRIVTEFGSMSGRGGTFRLELGDEVSEALGWDASEDELRVALERLDVGGAVEVTREEVPDINGFQYLVTFVSVVGDVLQLVADDSELVGTGADPTRVVISTESEGTRAHINTFASPLVEEVQVVRIEDDAVMSGSFHLTFLGESTTEFAWNVGAAELKAGLEGLGRVGSVEVNREDVVGSGLYGFEWAITWTPLAGHTDEHAANVGAFPPLLCVPQLSGNAPTARVFFGTSPGASTDGVATVSGECPFSAEVTAGAVSAPQCTAFDHDVVGRNGLSSGVCQSETSFMIESRDGHANLVLDGPQSELQVVRTWCDNNLKGSFKLSFMGAAVVVHHAATPEALQKLLQELGTVGVVVVTSTSATDAVLDATVSVTSGSSTVTSSRPLGDTFGVGDWIRIGSTEGHIYSVEHVSDSIPWTVTLSSPYAGPSLESTPVFQQGAFGRRLGYQYLIAFDSNLGDVAAVEVDGSSLYDEQQGEAGVEVTACDWYKFQTVTTHVDSRTGVVGGQFYLEMNGEWTSMLGVDATATEVQSALEALVGVQQVAVSREAKGAAGEYAWKVRFVQVEGALTPLRADGHLLTGAGARVVVTHTCPFSGGETAAAGTGVQAVPGRVGEHFAVQLTGGERALGDVVYVESGLYRASYVTPMAGVTYDLAVMHASVGGLMGEYFNNRWLHGDAVLTQVDATINFSWEGFITDTGKDFISVRWTGFVQPAYSEVYTFHVQVNDGARLWVDGELLLDAYEQEVSPGESFIEHSVRVSAPLVALRLYDIVLEFRETKGLALVNLAWSSETQPRQTVPSYRLFHSPVALVASPFQVTPVGIKPSPPTNVTVSVDAWDALLVSFEAPVNNGGEPVGQYRVEWYEPSKYGVQGVQTIKIANAEGGTFGVTSPGGYSTLNSVGPLPFDVAADVLEAALETLYDLGDVSVTSPESTELGRAFKVVFNTNLGDVAPLKVDATGLSGYDPVYVAVCAHGAASTSGPLLCGDSDSVYGTASLSSGGSVEVSDGLRSVVISGLEQGSDVEEGFNVRVSAYNSQGYGVYSVNVNVKPMDVPLAPREVELKLVPGAPDSLQVWWQAPSSDSSSVITMYSVEWDTDQSFASDMFGSVELEPVESRRFSWFGHTIGQLVEGEAYYVRVRALNAVGYGPGAVPASLTERPRTAPTQLEYGSVSLSTVPADESVSVLESCQSLLVSWGRSTSDNGSPVDSYLVEWWLEEDLQEIQVLHVLCDSAVSGTFQLSYGLEKTDYLGWDVDEGSLGMALEALSGIRGVHVERSPSSTTKFGHEWAITFLSYLPTESGLLISVDSEGLFSKTELMTGVKSISRSGTEIAVSVTEGSATVRHAATAAVASGDWVRIDGEVYSVEHIVDSSSFVLASVYVGETSSSITAEVGVSAPESFPEGYGRYVITDVLDRDQFSYTIPDLQSGIDHFVRVSAGNDRGYAPPQPSLPLGVAPLVQAPGVPEGVELTVYSDSGLRLVWSHPDSDGGDAVLKYKVEWDVSPDFGADSAQGALGSSDRKVTGTSTTCKLTKCTYIISGLERGTPYYVRVYAYNSYGYSLAQPATPWVETPKSQPEPPAVVLVTPDGTDHLLVRFPLSADDGGGEVTKYKVEWDATGAEGFDEGGYVSSSLLYSHYEIQSVTVSSKMPDLSGSFRIGFDGHATAPITVDASDEDVYDALMALAPIGDVVVSRKTEDNGFTWVVTFLTNGGHGEYFGDLPEMLVSADATEAVSAFGSTEAGPDLEGTGATVYVTTLVNRFNGYEQQQISAYASVGGLSGTFTLSWEGQTSSSLEWNASPEAVEEALEGFSGIGDLIVVRQRRSFLNNGDQDNGYVWTVVFLSLLGYVPSISADGSQLLSDDISGAAAVEVNRLVQGARPLMNSGLKSEVELPVGEVVMDSEGIVSFNATNLLERAPYHFRVSAWNGVGGEFGATMFSTPPTSFPIDFPPAPTGISVAAASLSELQVLWDASDMTDPTIEEYLVEWDASPTSVEQQVITVSASSGLGGVWWVSLDGERSINIPFDANERRVAASLGSINGVGEVSVTREELRDMVGYSWTVSFVDNVGDVSAMVGYGTGLSGTNAGIAVEELVKGAQPAFDQGTVGMHVLPQGTATVENTVEVQTIFMASSGGKFRVMYMGQLTPPLDFMASAEDAEEALEGLSTISNVEVDAYDVGQSTVPPLQRAGRKWVVTFLSEKGDLPSLLVSTGGRASSLAVGGTLSCSVCFVEVSETVKGGLAASYHISGLSSGSRYFVRVTTRNARGWGPTAVAPLSVALATQAPSEAVDVEVVIGSNTELSVSWSSPHWDGGLAVGNYSVEWDTNEAFTTARGVAAGSHMVLATEGAASYAHTITGLSSALSYFVRIVASNDIGQSISAFATPRDAYGEVQRLEVSASDSSEASTVLASSFTLSLGGDTTSELKFSAGAEEVQTALLELAAVDAVFVSRFDHSEEYDRSGTDTAPLRFVWVISFLLASGDVDSISISSTLPDPLLISLTTLREGRADADTVLSVSPSFTTPSGPASVSISVVSNTEVGVSWEAPALVGGVAVTKYLIEWDPSADVDTGSFSSREGDESGDSGIAATFSDVVEGSATQYKISGLVSGYPCFVRVSAYNADSSTALTGYSSAVLSEPRFVVLAPQVPYKPTDVGTYVSGPEAGGVETADIPSQIDLVWHRPSTDVHGFETHDGGAVVTHYTAAWDTVSSFDSDSYGSYDISTVVGDDAHIVCDGFCEFPLGAEVQTVSVYSRAEFSLDSGSYTLVYPVTGASTACIPHDASAATMALEVSEIVGGNKVMVSRESIDMSPGAGFKYRITFVDAGLEGDVEQLEVGVLGALEGCDDFTVNAASQVITATEIDGGFLEAGTPYFVRLSAVNSEGVGVPALATPDPEQPVVSNRWGSLSPRAPPGLPQDVRVYGTAESSSFFLVTWLEVDNENGSPVYSYSVEYYAVSEPGTVYTATFTDMDSAQPYQQSLTENVISGEYYVVRVRAYNDQGGGGPRCQGESTCAQIAVPTCNEAFDDCEEAHGFSWILARHLAKAPTFKTATIGTVISFTASTYEISFANPADTGGDGVLIDRFKVEWDTSPNFDSQDGKPVSYEWDPAQSGTSPEVLVDAFEDGDFTYVIGSQGDSLSMGQFVLCAGHRT